MVDITYKHSDNNFYDIRKATGYSQEDFAKILSTNRKQIFRWENKLFNPTPSQTATLLRIGINTHYMYGIGKLTLEGYSIEDVIKNIKELLNIPHKQRSAS